MDLTSQGSSNIKVVPLLLTDFISFNNIFSDEGASIIPGRTVDFNLGELECTFDEFFFKVKLLETRLSYSQTLQRLNLE